MATNVGKVFENDFKNSCPNNSFIHRIRDVSYGVKSLCDFIIYRYPKLILVELKTTKLKSLPVGNIADHQLESMRYMNEVKGVRSGFVINFREYDVTYYVSGDKLAKYIETEEVKSISQEWLNANGVKIEQFKKRTRWYYNYNFIDKI